MEQYKEAVEQRVSEGDPKPTPEEIRNSYRNPYKTIMILCAVLFGISAAGFAVLSWIIRLESTATVRKVLGICAVIFAEGMIRNYRQYRQFIDFKKLNPDPKCDFRYYLDYKDKEVYRK